MPNKHRKPSPQQPSVSWADLAHIFDSHGITPSAETPSSGPLAHVYDGWVKSEGLDPARPYAMPVHLLTGHVRLHLRTVEDRWVHDAELRALVTNALNDPDSGFVIVRRPFRAKRAA